MSAIREPFGESRSTIHSADASACKGMLLRTGAGQVKQISTKPLWALGAMQSHSWEMHTIALRRKRCSYFDTQRGVIN